jgi:hypothetical protein
VIINTSYSLKVIFFILICQEVGVAPSYQTPNQQQPFSSPEQPSILLASLEQYQGTIVPAPNFNVEADCQALSQSMKGAGKSTE